MPATWRKARVVGGGADKPFRLRTPSVQTEGHIQREAVKFLRAYLPAEVWFTASLSGIKKTPGLAAQAKAMGLERGAPDLSFIFPDGVTCYIEMKAPGCFMSDEQKALKRVLGDRMMVCRSVDEVRASVASWMAPHGLTWLSDAEAVKREIARRRDPA